MDISVNSTSTTTTSKTNWNSLALEIKTIIVNSYPNYANRSPKSIRRVDDWQIADLKSLLSLRLVNNELLALADNVFFELIPFSKLAAGDVDSFINIFLPKYRLKIKRLDFYVANSLFVGDRDSPNPLFPLELAARNTSSRNLRGGAPSASDVFLEEKRGHQLITLLTLLPNLTSISIDLVKGKHMSLYSYQYTQYQIASLLPNFTRLTKLCLSSPRPHFLLTCFLAKLLSNFPELVTLELTRVGETAVDINEGINLGTSISKLSKLKHLQINGSDCLDQYFFQQKWTQQLISFGSDRLVRAAILFPFLNQVGTNLSTLTITLTKENNTLPLLNLHSLTYLNYTGPSDGIPYFNSSNLVNTGEIVVTSLLKDSKLLIDFLSLLSPQDISIACSPGIMSESVFSQVEAYVAKVNMSTAGEERGRNRNILHFRLLRSTGESEDR